MDHDRVGRFTQIEWAARSLANAAAEMAGQALGERTIHVPEYVPSAFATAVSRLEAVMKENAKLIAKFQKQRPGPRMDDDPRCDGPGRM